MKLKLKSIRKRNLLTIKSELESNTPNIGFCKI